MGQDFWLARWTGQASRWNETELRDKKTEEAMQEFVEETVSGGISKDVTVVLFLLFSTYQKLSAICFLKAASSSSVI